VRLETDVADFSQTGAITTLHRLQDAPLDVMEGELQRFARTRRIGLVLPCLFDEFSRPALRGIVEDLRRARYVDRIVVSLGRTSAQGLAYAHAFFAGLPQQVSFVWNDGPRVQKLYQRLGEEGLKVDNDGKGRSFWIASGYLLASGDCEVIATHDCDITTYNRELLARLCYPLIHPRLQFDFAKGFYARISHEMNGRVTRLFVGPLLRALRQICGPLPILTYLESFRYPLAGEFAMTASLARATRLPSDWGLEIGVLSEVFRQAPLARVCQTELCSRYDHKHHAVGAAQPGTGLVKMSMDIAHACLRTLAAHGVTFTAAQVAEVLGCYASTAHDLIGRYQADAAINGLSFDRDREEGTVRAFADAWRIAGDAYVRNQSHTPPMIPSWERVLSTVPDFFEMLHDAVEHDSRATAVLASGAA